MDPIERLKRFPPFDRLEENDLGDLAARAGGLDMHPGDRMFRQGDASTGEIYLITEGIVELVVQPEGGEERVTGVFRPGDFFGVTAAFTGEAHSFTARAVTAGRLLTLPGQELERFLAVPDFARHFSRGLVHRMQRLYASIREEALGQGLDPFPFQRPLADLMSSPPLTCRPDLPVERAAAKMVAAHVSSLVVVDGQHQPLGILTDRDLAAKVVARGHLPGAVTAGQVMSSPLISLPPTALYHEALLVFARRGFKHLPVVEAGRVVGMVTIGDLTRNRSRGALRISARLEEARGVEDLALARREADALLKALLNESAAARTTAQVMTEINDRLVRRLLALTEEEMRQAGWGEPPVAYVWLEMGSAGRKEQTLTTDQDNALIYDALPEQVHEVEPYFAELARRVVTGLTRCGFAPCPGGVMASNPAWRRGLEDWRRQVRQWIRRPGGAEVRQASIFLDFRPVWGEARLADELRRFILAEIGRLPLFLQFLARDDLSRAVPVGPVAQLLHRVSRGRELDLKKEVGVHLVDCTRVLALRAQLTGGSTWERLEGLRSAGLMSRDDVELVDWAYQVILDLRIRHNVARLAQGLPPDNTVDPGKLSLRRREALQDALVAAARLQQHVGSVFKVPGYV